MKSIYFSSYPQFYIGIKEKNYTMYTALKLSEFNIETNEEKLTKINLDEIHNNIDIVVNVVHKINKKFDANVCDIKEKINNSIAIDNPIIKKMQAYISEIHMNNFDSMECTLSMIDNNEFLTKFKKTINEISEPIDSQTTVEIKKMLKEIDYIINDINY